MPNHPPQDQDVLSEAQRALTLQSRQPALGMLDDPALLALIAALEQACATAAATGDPVPAKLLRQALQRAHADRRGRGLRKPPAAGPAAAAKPTAGPAAAKPAAARPGIALGSAIVTKATPPAVKRKGATIARKPAGRKPAEARKTDLRTEPHRIPKRRVKPAAASGTASPPSPSAPATRTSVMSETTADKPAKMAAPKKPRDPVTGSADQEAAKEAARIERRAAKAETKAAEKDAAKAAKLAAKETEKAERKAARKALKQSERAAEKATATAGDKPKGAKGRGKEGGDKGRSKEGGAKAKADPQTS